MSNSASTVIAASATGALIALAIAEMLRRMSSHDLHKQLQKMQDQVQQLQAAQPSLQAPEVEKVNASPTRRERRVSRCSWEQLPPAIGIRRQESLEEEARVNRHTEDSAFRALNVNLMERGRTANVRAVGQMYAPQKTKVVRIALTGGPCAGKSSALDHLIAAATAEGFDVLTAPEIATLFLNTGYQFPSPSAANFGDQKFSFQKNIIKLQLQLERCYSDLAGSTGRPTIVVFDRGMRDCKAFMSEEEWGHALMELNKELANGPLGRINDDYILKRYDGVIHLVTAADGAEEHYKFGIVEDDSGGQVYRRETPVEAVEQDRLLQKAWAGHPHHIVVANGDRRGFEGKIEDATEAVLAIARLLHPSEMRRAKEIRDERKRSLGVEGDA
mmetsp:Transcript_35856/g.94222  ORF Transcript_35856/g.94222 Transcript_35856/m.94222 type:complete len:387 (-) Transcript_35856:172-1332(-)